jgi:hypothetical protein
MGKYRDQNLITLQTHDGRYLSAQPSGAIILTKDHKETEEFTISKVGKKVISLKTTMDTVVHFHQDGSIEHHKTNWTDALANLKLSSKPQISEVYLDVIKTKPKHVGFRTTFGKFLGVKEGTDNLTQTKYLNDDSTFEITVVKQSPKIHKENKIKPGKKYQIKTIHKMYWNLDDDFHLRQHSGPSETSIFQMINNGESSFLIGTPSGKYLTIKEDNSFFEDTLENAQSFEPVHSHGKIAFKLSSGKFISAEKDGTILTIPSLKSNAEFELLKV